MSFEAGMNRDPIEAVGKTTAASVPGVATNNEGASAAANGAPEIADPSIAKLGSDDEDVARVVAEAIEKEAIEATVEDEQPFAEGDALCQPVAATHRRTNSDTSRKKRLCRFPGCTRVIKSQGHCQRHGAKAKRCKVEGCEKQAQGTHNGMCKRHWRAVHFPDQVAAKEERKKELEEQPPPPQGESVYDNVLPASIAYRPSFAQRKEDPSDTPAPDGKALTIVAAMPLVNFLRDGALHKPYGWHRQAERRARGILQCSNLQSQLEPWEKQLALVEIMLLSGGTPHANFKDLAHAWGREKGFHQVLASSVCTRRGEVQRKKRSDAGKKSTPVAKRIKAEPTPAPTIYPPPAPSQLAPPVQPSYEMQWQQQPPQGQPGGVAELKSAPPVQRAPGDTKELII